MARAAIRLGGPKGRAGLFAVTLVLKAEEASRRAEAVGCDGRLGSPIATLKELRMDEETSSADWDQSDDDLSLCPVAGWRTANHPVYGVALQLSYFASEDELRSDAPSGVQVLLSAGHAIALGEELVRQGQAALDEARPNHSPN